MRKLIITMALLVIGGPAFAAGPGEVRLIFSGGLGASGASYTAWTGRDVGVWMLGDPTLFNNGESEVQAAWNIGIGAGYYFNETLSLITGLYYDSKPLKFVYPRNTALNDLVFEVNAAFITVPVGLRVHLNAFFFGGGLYAGFLVNDDVDIKAGDVTIATGELDGNSEFGLFVDVGVDFSVSEKGSILVFARYEHGLSYYYNKEDIVTDIKTRSLQFNVGYAHTL